MKIMEFFDKPSGLRRVEMESDDATLERILELVNKGLEFEEFQASRSYFTGWANWQHLVKLGQWAQEHAVSALSFYSKGGNFSHDVWLHPSLGYFTGKRAGEVLALLPKPTHPPLSPASEPGRKPEASGT